MILRVRAVERPDHHSDLVRVTVADADYAPIVDPLDLSASSPLGRLLLDAFHNDCQLELTLQGYEVAPV